MIALWLAAAALAVEPPAVAAAAPTVAAPTVAAPAVAAPAVAAPAAAAPAPASKPSARTAALLGPAPSASPVAADLVGLWPFGLAALGAGIAVLARRRTVGKSAELRIVSRTSVNGQSALLLVDVRDPSGRDHRLLVGTGGGPPALVADLGVLEDEDEPTIAYAGRSHGNELLEMPTLPNLRDSSRGNRKAAAQELISQVVEERRVAMVRP